MKSLVVAALSIALFASNAQSQQKTQSSAEWKAVDDALGRSGKMQPGDVYKFGMPRSDMQVTVNGIKVSPALALGSWVAFKRMGNESMVMGDLVLKEDEVEAVMLKLQQGGIEQTALHNHVLHESPRVMYMHVSGHGDAVKLARALRDALALTATPSKAAAPTPVSAEMTNEAEVIGKALGYKGTVNGGVVQFSVPRAEKITDNGMEIPPSMGTATGLNFQLLGGGKAVITGDFVLVASEVNPVIRALRENGIEVTAVHSHMLTEQPRLFFMHFWANDNAEKLAGGLRKALDATNSAKPQ